MPRTAIGGSVIVWDGLLLDGFPPPRTARIRPNRLAVAQTCFYSPGMSRKQAYFLLGFTVGAVVSLLWNAMPIIRAGVAPSIPGIWLDIALQAVIIGLLLGLVAMWFGTRRRNRN
jgi:hypothetical protein